MQFYLPNIVLTILSVSQLASSATLPEANETNSPLTVNDSTKVPEVTPKGATGYGGSYYNPYYYNYYNPYYWYQYYPYYANNQYPKPIENNKLNSAYYVGKKLVRNGQVPPPYGGNFVYEASFPKPYRIIRPGDAVTLDYRPDRLNVSVDKNDIITSLSYG